MAESKPEVPLPAPAPVPKSLLRRRLTRVLKWIGGLLGLLLVFLILLPTLLSTLPLDRWASRFASGMVPGDIRIEDIRLAWFSPPIRLGRVVLEDPARTEGRRFLLVEDIRISRSLGQLLFTEDRLGTITIGRIDVDAVRDADGTLNLTAFIPPADPNAPPPPPSEPFVLDLEKLVPEFPNPLPQLSILAPRIDMKFTDHSASPTVAAGLRDASFAATWKGGREPLHLGLKGEAAGTTMTLPVTIDATLADWMGPDGRTTLRSLRFEARARADGSRAATVSAALREGALTWGVDLPLAPWDRFVRIHPAAATMPHLSGTLIMGGAMTPSGDAQTITFDADSKAVAVSAQGRPPLVLPDVALRAGARIHKRTFDRDAVFLTTESTLFRLAVKEDRSGTSGSLALRLLSIDGSLRTEDLVNFTRKAALTTGTIPEVEGGLAIGASVLHHDTAVDSGTLTLGWTGGRAVLPAAMAFPAALQPRDRELDLRPTTFRVVAAARPRPGGMATGDFRIENELIPVSGTFDVTDPRHGRYSIATDVSLGRVMEFVEGEFAMEPAMSLDGEVAFRAATNLTSDTLTHDGSLTIGGLRFATSAVPDFTYEDELELRWEGNADLAPAPGAGIDLTFRSDYTTATLVADYRAATLRTFRAESAVHLGEIAGRILPAFMPEMPATVAGSVLLAAEASEPTAKSYDFATTATAAPDFQVFSPAFSMGLNAFTAGARGNVALAEDGLNFRADEAVVTLEDFAEARLSGRVGKSGDLVTFEGSPVLSVQYDSLLAKAAPYLADGFAMSLEAAGATTVESTFSGTVQMAPEGMVWPEPVALSATISTDVEALEWQAPDRGMSASVVALRDVRQWTVRANPAAPTDAAFREENESTIGSVGFAMSSTTDAGESHTESTIEGIALEMTTDVQSGQQVSWELSSLGAEIIAATMASPGAEPVTVRIPEFAASAALAADVPAQHFDLQSFDLRAADLLMTSGSLTLDLTNLNEAGTERDIALVQRTTLSAPDFGRLPALAQPDATATILEGLAGSIGSEIDARLALRQSPDGVVPTDYDGRALMTYSGLALTMPGTVTLKTASGEFSLEGTPRGARLDTTNEFSIRLLNQPQLPDLDGMRLFSQMELTEAGDFNVENFAFSSEQLGTLATLRGTLRDAVGIAKSASAEAADSSPLDTALAIPTELFFTFEQQLPGLDQTGYVQDSSGTLALQSRLVNLPNSKTEIQFEASASEGGFRYGEMVEIRGIRGSFPFLQPIFHKPVPPPPAVYGEGGFHIAQIRVTMPPYDLRIRDLNTQIVAETHRYRLVSRSPDFFGGSFEFNGRLALRDGDPLFTGNYGLTGLDAGMFLPNLTRGPLESREIDVFGSAAMRLPRNPTMTAVFEETTIRMEVAEMGPEVLRGALRKMQQAGSSPGIQATLAALRFSRPGASRLDIQGGLMTASVEMVSPGGIRYTIPILENATIANALGAYGNPEQDAQVVLLREGLAILLAGNMQPVRQFLASRSTAP